MRISERCFTKVAIFAATLKFTGLPPAELSKLSGLRFGQFADRLCLCQRLVQFASQHGFTQHGECGHQLLFIANLDGWFLRRKLDAFVAVSDVQHQLTAFIFPPPTPEAQRHFLAGPLASFWIIHPTHATLYELFVVGIRRRRRDLVIDDIAHLLAQPRFRRGQYCGTCLFGEVEFFEDRHLVFSNRC